MGRINKTLKVEPVPKKWLSKSEAQAYLGVSEAYLQKLRDGAHVAFSQDGKTVWYLLSSLDKWVEKNIVIRANETC